MTQLAKTLEVEENDYKELGDLPIGNPLTLLAYAFCEGKKDECLEILTNIHFYLFRKAPSSSLRKLWREQLDAPAEITRREFTMKVVRNRVKQSRHYFVELTVEAGCYDECGLEYSNESNTMGLECGPHSRIVRRGFQLEGMRPPSA